MLKYKAVFVILAISLWALVQSLDPTDRQAAISDVHYQEGSSSPQLFTDAATPERLSYNSEEPNTQPHGASQGSSTTTPHGAAHTSQRSGPASSSDLQLEKASRLVRRTHQGERFPASEASQLRLVERTLKRPGLPRKESHWDANVYHTLQGRLNLPSNRASKSHAAGGDYRRALGTSHSGADKVMPPSLRRNSVRFVQRLGPRFRLWRRVNGNEPQPGPSTTPGSSTWLTRDDVLRRIGLPPSDRDAEPISEFLRRNQPLLHRIHQAPQLRQDLLEVYQPYRGAIPIIGAQLDLDDHNMMTRNFLDNIGRDRFRHMDPIISSLLSNAGLLRLDRVRTDFLKALDTRFKETEQLLSPTREEIDTQQKELVASYNRGQLSWADFGVQARGLQLALERRSKNGVEKHDRFKQDLALINILEKELERIRTSL